jgi:hypothetical protein
VIGRATMKETKHVGDDEEVLLKELDGVLRWKDKKGRW